MTTMIEFRDAVYRRDSLILAGVEFYGKMDYHDLEKTKQLNWDALECNDVVIIESAILSLCLCYWARNKEDCPDFNEYALSWFEAMGDQPVFKSDTVWPIFCGLRMLSKILYPNKIINIKQGYTDWGSIQYAN